MRNDILRPVPVMGVKVPNGNALDATVEGGKGRDSCVAEITETHRSIPRRVMPGGRMRLKARSARRRQARSRSLRRRTR